MRQELLELHRASRLRMTLGSASPHSDMFRSLCLLLALISLANSFYLGNYYVGALPYRFMDSPYESRLALGQMRGGRDFSAGDTALLKDKKDTPPIKRFKPCYYSPIQCLIKRRAGTSSSSSYSLFSQVCEVANDVNKKKSE